MLDTFWTRLAIIEVAAVSGEGQEKQRTVTGNGEAGSVLPVTIFSIFSRNQEDSR